MEARGLDREPDLVYPHQEKEKDEEDMEQI